MNGESSSDKRVTMLQGGNLEPHNVPIKYLRNITNNFSDERLLGQGGFGMVYKGVLQNGETIAVKKFNSSIPGVKDRQFENEANHLMRLKHQNVVALVGWCSEMENIYVEYNGKYICAEKSERLLCLEYMPKGNLRGYLSDELSGLAWDTRYKIIEGICYGLLYLHEEWQLNAPIVHMDLKPANILLDDNMVPKIADFGLSRLFSEEKTWTCTVSRDGTLGYMSPEYINRGRVSTMSDIFSLGVIIMEIVTGRRDYPDDTGTPFEEFIEMVLHNWSQRKRIIGVSLEVNYQQIRRCIQIGLDCVKTDWSKRPTISKIIKALHGPESADSSNIKGVHGPQSGKRDRNCGETSWVERLAKKHTSGFSIYETFTVALHQWQKKIALRRIQVIFTTVVFVVLLKKRAAAICSVTSRNPARHLHQQPQLSWEEVEVGRSHAAHQLKPQLLLEEAEEERRYAARQLRVSLLPPGARKRYRSAMHDSGGRESTSSSGPPPRRQRQQPHPSYSPPPDDSFVDRATSYSYYGSLEGFVTHSDSNGNRNMPMSMSTMLPGSPRRTPQKMTPTRLSVWQRIEENPSLYTPPYVRSAAFPGPGVKKVKKIVIKKIVRKIGAKDKQTNVNASEKEEANANASEKEEGEITTSSFEKDVISAHNLVSTSDTTGQ